MTSLNHLQVKPMHANQEFYGLWWNQDIDL